MLKILLNEENNGLLNVKVLVMLIDEIIEQWNIFNLEKFNTSASINAASLT